MVYAFLKTEHKEQLITLCIRDDDNLLLLVAVAIVDKESEETYTYFLQNCMKSADFAATSNSKDMTIFTDGHKGSPSALAKCFYNVEVYRCQHHYIRNAPAIGSVSAECRGFRESFRTRVDVFSCGRCWKRTYFIPCPFVEQDLSPFCEPHVSRLRRYRIHLSVPSPRR